MSPENLPYITFEYKEPVVYINFNKSVIVDEKQIFEMIEFRNRLVNHKPHLVLTIFDAAVDFTPEARLAGAKNNFNSIAHAVVVKRLGQRLLTDAYKEIDRPLYPLKVFNEEGDALKWLLKHLD